MSIPRFHLNCRLRDRFYADQSPTRALRNNEKRFRRPSVTTVSSSLRTPSLEVRMRTLLVSPSPILRLRLNCTLIISLKIFLSTVFIVLSKK